MDLGTQQAAKNVYGNAYIYSKYKHNCASNATMKRTIQKIKNSNIFAKKKMLINTHNFRKHRSAI